MMLEPQWLMATPYVTCWRREGEGERASGREARGREGERARGQDGERARGREARGREGKAE